MINEHNIPAFEELVGHEFDRKSLLFQAITDSSYFQGWDTPVSDDYGTLELLGDAILRVAVVDYFSTCRLPEGWGVSKRRIEGLAQSNEFLYGVAKEIMLDDFWRIREEVVSRWPEGRQRKLPANMMEAIIAAIYRDRNFEEACRFVDRHINSRIERLFEFPRDDWMYNLRSLLPEEKQDLLRIEEITQTMNGQDNGSTTWQVFFEDQALSRVTGKDSEMAQDSAAFISLVFFMKT